MSRVTMLYYHVMGPGLSMSLCSVLTSMAPCGEDLTGQVTVLTYPNQQYVWTIGEGSFSNVVKGEWRKKGAAENGPPTLVAVKIFRGIHNDTAEKVNAISRRLVRESNTWLRLSHPNIQPYFGHCANLAPSVALISPYCGNGTVMHYIRSHPFDENLRPKFVTDVAKGLEYLHGCKIIHGDLQANNILVDDAKNARLSDFGRAKILGEAGYSTALLAGCAPYMAPELFPEDDTSVDSFFTPHSDVYAFGMLAFEIFTDEIPFLSLKATLHGQIMLRVLQGVRPSRTSDQQFRISDTMWQIIENCWVRDPMERPPVAWIVQRIG